MKTHATTAPIRVRANDLFFIIIFFFIFPSPVFSFEVIGEIQGGRIQGHVRWGAAAIPDRAVLAITKNTDFCGLTFVDDALLVNAENRGMQNVVVYLEDITRGRSPQSRHVNVIKKCRFHPREEDGSSKKNGGHHEIAPIASIVCSVLLLMTPRIVWAGELLIIVNAENSVSEL